MSKVTYDTYPRYVDIDRDGINQKVFTNSNGNEEWCLPTGRKDRILWTIGLNTRTAKAVFTTVDNYNDVRRNYG